MPRKPPVAAPDVFNNTFSVMVPMTEDELLRLYVEHVLAECNGNKTLAGSVLGIDRKSVYRRLGLCK